MRKVDKKVNCFLAGRVYRKVFATSHFVFLNVVTFLLQRLIYKASTCPLSSAKLLTPALEKMHSFREYTVYVYYIHKICILKTFLWPVSWVLFSPISGKWKWKSSSHPKELAVDIFTKTMVFMLAATFAKCEDGFMSTVRRNQVAAVLDHKQ